MGRIVVPGLDGMHMDAGEMERGLVERSAAGDGPGLVGPVHIIDTANGVEGGATYHVSASHLVAVDDDDPDLAGVTIPVPVTVEVKVDKAGAILEFDVPADPDAQRQARAFTRNLIANGAVSGLTAGGPGSRSAGPRTRATHEVTTDEFGRRVIRRTGFSTTSLPDPQTTP